MQRPAAGKAVNGFEPGTVEHCHVTAAGLDRDDEIAHVEPAEYRGRPRRQVGTMHDARCPDLGLTPRRLRRGRRACRLRLIGRRPERLAAERQKDRQRGVHGAASQQSSRGPT